MAHFYFHFSDGESQTRDELGLELDTAEQAYLEAFATTRSMWPELLAARCNPLDCSFEVADANGAVLFRLPFSELFDACRPPRAPGAQSQLRQSIAATHVRARAAREDIRFGFDQVRQSLQEANDLLGRLASFERTSGPFQAADFAGRAVAG